MKALWRFLLIVLITIGQPERAWRADATTPVKVTDSLVLSIPLEYEGNPYAIARPGNHSASFEFFLPDFGGYTPERRKSRVDENKVTVWYVTAHNTHGAPPDSVGLYPPNQIKNVLKYLVDQSGGHKDIDGLECYPGRAMNQAFCYGERDATQHLVIEIAVPPYPGWVVYPQMRTDYFSPRYDGLEISWSAHVRNLARWRDIDAQIWKFLSAWNVAPGQSPEAGGKRKR